MKLIADPIYVPDNADWQTIEDAKSRANWHIVRSREERMEQTNLNGKCGSCKYYQPKRGCYGNCLNGHVNYRQRTTPACKDYIEIE